MSKDIDWAALVGRQAILGAMPATLQASARPEAFAKGATLFRQGARPTAMFCILAGEVRLVRHGSDGREIVLQRCREGFTAEASLDSPGYHCDALAGSDGALLRFPIAAFRATLVNDALFNRRWLTHLAGEVRRLRMQCERLSLRSADARVIHCIETEGSGGRLVLTQSRKAWAAELGLTHEALYRTLAALAGSGVLSIEGDALALRPGRASSK
jgi:CRP-like cAMP-binding protein